jgi:Tfp pilus assembly protein PilV
MLKKLFFKTKKAVTLVEILLAVVLMAGAFLPIMGLMTSSIKVTEQDENTQRAVMLCQEKLNAVLQMPFDKFSVNSKPIVSGTYNNNEIVASFGAQIIDGVTYTSSLLVEQYNVSFNVPTCDFTRKGDSRYKNDPSQWGFNVIQCDASDKVKRFTVTVNWQDKGKDNQKFYTLSSLKADIREK